MFKKVLTGALAAIVVTSITVTTCTVSFASEEVTTKIQETLEEEPQEILKEEAQEETKEAGDYCETLPVSFEKTIEYNGEYQISLTYDEKTGFPETGCSLEVCEITDEAYDHYLKESADKAGLNEELLTTKRVFDIHVKDDKTGEEIEPECDVDVTITLPGEEITKDTAIVHFSDNEETTLIDADIKEDALTFTTDGFSVYAIVSGPSDMPVTWDRLKTMDDFTAYCNDGLYIGTTSGYFITNKEAIASKDAATTGLVKTQPARTFPDPESAAKFYFEQEDGLYYIYCYDDAGNRVYARNEGDQNLYLVPEEEKTGFCVIADNNGRFRIYNGDRYWNMWNGAGGSNIACWTSATDSNNYMYMWKSKGEYADPYGLDKKNYGLMNFNGGASGRAMMGEEGNNALCALPAAVLTNKTDSSDSVFIPADSDISLWTFEWAGDDYYYIQTETDSGLKYLQIKTQGIFLSESKDAACRIRVIPGTGSNAGSICLKNGNGTVSYSGAYDTGFVRNAAAGSEWLKPAVKTELTQDHVLTYSADKVSVSDASVTNGSRIIVYARTWNESKKKYEFYAIDHDGSVASCYESGGAIQWVGGQLNTLLWNLVEYRNENDEVTHYYELYNQYSEKYISPGGSDVLSDEPVGIHLTGRKKGQYYTPILSWSDAGYAFNGLKIENGRIVSCPYEESDDFYFALIKDIPADDVLETVDTIDHTQYGIRMKMVNFPTRTEMSSFLGSDKGGAVSVTDPGLLSSYLDPSTGYPKTKAGNSLSDWFMDAQEVNHLFIGSTYEATGYFSYDSTQNFASLNEETGDFTVYKQIGTMDNNNNASLKHGQFMPYNDLASGSFASVNAKNLTDAKEMDLLDGSPRKNEQLYLVKNPDYYFGVEIDADFTQTANGLDAWGHDIIYEFTGDDDFWLYVDGELIIDLGGIHRAIPGSVNYSTGEINVNGKETTLREVFEENYKKRNPDASKEETDAYLNRFFNEGETVFKDYTTHTMTIFYFERGAGASNLNMWFNLSAVKPGQVTLRKEVTGTEKSDYQLSEYAYQIWYKTSGDDGYTLLDNDTDTKSLINVTYQNTNKSVKFEDSFSPAGSSTIYRNVYFLKANQTATITVPDDTISYYIKECGVNPQVYDHVEANDEILTGETNGTNRMDYSIVPKEVLERQRVVFKNHVNEEAKRTLTITKRLFDDTGKEITDDPTPFNFRLYLGGENDTDLLAADMYEYHVRDRYGDYCIWDKEKQGFVSIHKSDYSALTAEEKSLATFQTSMYGAISMIPAGYRIEVRDLLVGTRFKVTEDNIPVGYTFLRYVRDGASYIIADGDTLNSGTIRENESPAVEIHNKRGYGIQAKKLWSDEGFVSSHGDIFLGVYADETLIDDSIRMIKHPQTSVTWYWDELPDNTDLKDIHVRELSLSGDYDERNGIIIPDRSCTVTAVSENSTIAVSATDTDGNESDYDYTVRYQEGSITGTAKNARSDSIANIRNGIKIIKEDCQGNPLPGAWFAITEQNGKVVGNESYVSDANGFVTTAYVETKKVYTLRETASPAGYEGAGEIRFLLNKDQTVSIEKGNVALLEVSESDGMPCIIIKNKPYTLNIKKYGETETGEDKPLSGVHFSLYREVTVNGVTGMAIDPISGMEDLVTDKSGNIPLPDRLINPGTYYLKEKSAPEGYEVLMDPVKITISKTGSVTIGRNRNASLDKETTDDEIFYTLTVKDEKRSIVPSGFYENKKPYMLILMFGILLLAFVMLARKRNRFNKEREVIK